MISSYSPFLRKENKMERIGFMMVYNEIDWVSYAIDQATLLCDRLIICEGAQFTSFPHLSERSDDGTLDVIEDKKVEYPKFIEVMNTARSHSNYRRNQCENFNNALSKCNEGDYFLPLDVDVFYKDSLIERLNSIMVEGKIDVVRASGTNFAFGFNWKRADGDGSLDIFNHEPVYKKTADSHFVPTHQPRGFGFTVVSMEGQNIFHYTWVKPSKRMRVRMETSGFHPGMLSWFDNNWDFIELKENVAWKNHLGGVFKLIKYDGPHPKVLDSHPWRNVNDVRKYEV
jgi:glycosyltransferase involved in cell wall biosynthesis